MTTTRHTARELSELPTISSSQADDLKIDTGTVRVWLAHVGIADGMKWENTVTVEEYDARRGCWSIVEEYDGGSTTTTTTIAPEFTATRRADQPMLTSTDPEPRDMFAWDITLSYDGRRLVLPYFTGKGLVTIPSRDQRRGDPLAGRVDADGRYYNMRTDRWTPAPPTVPTWDDVAECLALDAGVEHVSFDEWASDYGYDEDSRAAERTYNACREQVEQLRQLFGADWLRFLAEQEARRDAE